MGICSTQWIHYTICSVYILFHYNMNPQFRLRDMVFAKCENYPYWPSKILEVFPNGSYKVLFYGEKSEATIDESCIIPYNEENYRRMSSDQNAKSSQKLKFSLSVAHKSYMKRKRGFNSQEEDDDYFQQSQTKKMEYASEPKPKHKFITVKSQPENLYLELTSLLDSLSSQSSSFKRTDRVFTYDQQQRLRYLLTSNNQLLLSSLIEYRVIQKFIIVLKELDQWGLKEWPQLNELHILTRNRYEDYKAKILSEEFMAVPVKESKRQLIIQKVLKNKAVL